MSMTFFFAAGGMLLVGFLMAALPLLRHGRYVSAAVVAIALIGGSVVLYPIASNYQPRSAAFDAVSQAQTEEEARIAADALSEELMAQPDNFEGWRLLGRARMELNELKAAEFAFRQALRTSPFQDPELMVMLGETLTYAGGQEIPQEAIDLFLSARQMAPNNPKALWYAGLAHAARGENISAAEAWEALLATSPPPDVAAILSERIAVLRATATPAIAAGADPTDVAAAGVEGATSIRLNVSLSDSVVAEWPATARLFVSVRDPERPGPPLAAVQYSPDALPLSVSLDDNNAMMPGRTISSATRYEIVARVSISGDPLGGAGDLLGRLRLDTSELGEPVALVIDQVAE